MTICILPARSGSKRIKNKNIKLFNGKPIISYAIQLAKSAKLPYEFLDHVSTRIINEGPGISRVTLDISSKPPSTIEWE